MIMTYVKTFIISSRTDQEEALTLWQIRFVVKIVYLVTDKCDHPEPSIVHMPDNVQHEVVWSRILFIMMR